MKEKILGGIVGLCVADALGVPVEFCSRESLKIDPVTDMRGYGTYNQPPGTWSDDTSLTLCLLDSLTNGLNYRDIMERFASWANEGCYTPFGEMFDIGITTRKAITRFIQGTNPLLCGGTGDRDNGNGSLMRILPIVFYLNCFVSEDDDWFHIIHNISALTHGHKRSLIACGIYVLIAKTLLTDSKQIDYAIKSGINGAKGYYSNHNEYNKELKYFNRIFKDDFKNLPQEEIKSGGYVVDTLEAAIWCLLNSKSYEECVLKAVNLGSDTDTVAAICGGLAGMFYGVDSIPKSWRNKIANLDYVEDLCEKYYISLCRPGAEKMCSYIPYFKNLNAKEVFKWIEGETLEKGTTILSYPYYEEKVMEFVDDFYKSGLSDYNYIRTIDKYVDHKSKDISKMIDKANLELTKAIFTLYIRKERFCDGTWFEAIENGVFLALLQRLQTLLIKPEEN